MTTHAFSVSAITSMDMGPQKYGGIAHCCVDDQARGVCGIAGEGIAAADQDGNCGMKTMQIDIVSKPADDYATLPDLMKSARRWLLWKSEPNPDRSKKPRKVPFYADGGRRRGNLDSPSDQAKLATFEEVINTFKKGGYKGLGFALGPDGTGNFWQGIDFDDMPNRPLLDGLAKELPGYTETSPSTKGKHAIGYGRSFAALGSNATGIEAYAAGRFFTVTAADAGIHPPTCLADFVENRLKPLHCFKPDAPSNADTPTSYEEVSPQTISDLRSALNSMRADDRQLWIDVGHALKTLGDVGRGLWLDWSATSAKFDPQPDAETWDSFKPTHTSYKTVFAKAQSMGWLNPMSNAAHGAHEGGFSGNSDTVASLEQNIITLSTDESLPDFLPHYVDMWIPQNEVTLLAGHGGGGKSYAALSIAVHVALGLQFGTLATMQANVLFFSGEDGGLVLRQRLSKLCRALKIVPAQLEGKLHLLDASDIDPALHREQRVTVDGRQQIVTQTPLLDALAKLVQKLDVGLVVIDNASDTYDDDEIKRARVRTFVRSLRSRIARPSRAVLLLAHINKASANGGKNAGTEDYSGSTAWHNSVRSRLSLIPVVGDALTIDHLKANLGAKAGPVRLEWHEGVPLVAGSYTSAGVEAAVATEKVRVESDKTALVTLIQDFDRRGERVTTSSQGSATVFKLLKGEPGFPDNTDSSRLMLLLRALQDEGRIYRRTVRTPDRKSREVFTCKSEVIAAPIPEDGHCHASTEQNILCAN